MRTITSINVTIIAFFICTAYVVVRIADIVAWAAVNTTCK